MDRIPGGSNSAILWIGVRDSATGDFEICFRGGTAFRHRDVPPEVYEGLMAAKFKGTYYFEHLKNRFGAEKI